MDKKEFTSKVAKQMFNRMSDSAEFSMAWRQYLDKKKKFPGLENTPDFPEIAKNIISELADAQSI
jgi:hypothetical protein